LRQVEASDMGLEKIFLGKLRDKAWRARRRGQGTSQQNHANADRKRNSFFMDE